MISPPIFIDIYDLVAGYFNWSRIMSTRMRTGLAVIGNDIFRHTFWNYPWGMDKFDNFLILQENRRFSEDPLDSDNFDSGAVSGDQIYANSTGGC
jgi:hypothetical protein